MGHEDGQEERKEEAVGTSGGEVENGTRETVNAARSSAQELPLLSQTAGYTHTRARTHTRVRTHTRHECRLSSLLSGKLTHQLSLTRLVCGRPNAPPELRKIVS